MLKPEFFEGKEELVVKYYQELEDYLLEDIATFLIRSEGIGGKADRELLTLKKMGMTDKKIISILADITQKSRKEVKKILQQSVMTSFSEDKDILDKYLSGEFGPLKNPVIVEVMNAEWMKTCGELENLTMTALNAYNSELVNLLNKAEILVASGSKSYASAVCEVIDEYAKTGMMVNYPSGTKRTLEAAVRCAVVTSMNQTAAQVTNRYIKEAGIEYVLVSAHLGARHDRNHPAELQSHDWWQGKAFKIRGSEPGFPNLLESTGYDINLDTGKGKVVNPLGLHGYNCRHSHQPWEKELKNPWLDDDGNPIIDREESQKIYNMQQSQRAMERSIRSSKRRLKVKQTEIDNLPDDSMEKANAIADYDALAYRLREKNKAYNKFCKDNNLVRQSDRLKVAGFSKKDANKANGRASSFAHTKRYMNIPEEWNKTKNRKISTDLSIINQEEGYENCASCVIAYEMRQRGFDVYAKKDPVISLVKSPWNGWRDIEPIEGYEIDDIIELIKCDTKKCRYELAFDHKYGSHCVLLEKFEGTISIVDAQLGTRYEPLEYAKRMSMSNILFWNVSSAEISEEGVKACKILKK